MNSTDENSVLQSNLTAALTVGNGLPEMTSADSRDLAYTADDASASVVCSPAIGIGIVKGQVPSTDAADNYGLSTSPASAGRKAYRLVSIFKPRPGEFAAVEAYFFRKVAEREVFLGSFGVCA